MNARPLWFTLLLTLLASRALARAPAEPQPQAPPAEPQQPPQPESKPAPLPTPAPLPETTKTPAHAGEKPPLTAVLGKFEFTLYGFVEFDLLGDTTQSFNDRPANTNIAHEGTFAANNGRLQMSVRNSRLGLKAKGPNVGSIRTSAMMEMDFLGNQPSPLSDNAFFTNPTFRIRHFNFKLETPYIDILFGQYWQLFGWQSYFHPATVEIQGVPGQLYSRAPQIRFGRVFKLDPLSLELGLAFAMPPQRDSV